MKAQLVFSDTFNKRTLEANKWSTYHKAWDLRTLASIGHQQLYVEQGYKNQTFSINPHTINKGKLSLIAQRSPNLELSEKLPYISAMISTEKSYTPLYGYFEASLCLPLGKGLWPAIWMIPSDGNDHLPEIDIMESLGHQPDVIYQSTHLDNNALADTLYGSGMNIIQKGSKSFYTYGLDWNQETITWYINGVQTYKVKNYAFEPHYYIINLAVGGTWPGNPDNTTLFPTSLDIEYVCIYTHNPYTE
jgi:beta-glucanase (GH16 family)